MNTKPIIVALFVAFCLTNHPLHAQRVSPQNARKAAQTFLQVCGGKCDNPSELKDITEALGFSNLYAFNGTKGYVVLSADESVPPCCAFRRRGILMRNDCQMRLEFG